MLKIHVASKLLSWIFKILKMLKNVKKYQQKILFSEKMGFFRILKHRNICERLLSGVYVYKISSIYLEKCLIFGVLKVEKDRFSRYFWRFLHFLDFQTLSDLGQSKSVLRSFFAFLTKNWPRNVYHAAQTLNFKFDS